MLNIMNDIYQDPNLPPGYREEEQDEIQEDTTSLEEKLELLESECDKGDFSE